MRRNLIALALLATVCSAQRTTPVAGYYPSSPAAAVVAVAYAIVAGIHVYHWWRYGQRYMLTLIVGMVCMVLGYLVRIAYAQEPLKLGAYVGSTFFTIISPCFFLATDYLVLARFADHVGPAVYEPCLFLPKVLIVRGFLWSDIITGLLQGGGGGLTIMTGIMSTIGKWITLIGLIIQAISFILFTALMIVFLIRVRSQYPALWNRGGSKSPLSAWKGGAQELDWRVLFAGLGVSCVGIIIRSVFRVIEYSEGYDGHLRTTEIYLYVLDALPLFLSMSVFAFVWPTCYMLPGTGAGAIPMYTSTASSKREYTPSV